MALSLPKTPAWIKHALIGGSVFFVCWAIAIAYWRATRSVPATGELAVCLLAMPLALIGTVWLGTRLTQTRMASPAAPAPVPPAAPAPAAPALASLAILASALRSPHGASAEELAAAIASGKARADLDPELIDEDGFPVMAARSRDAVDEALRTEIIDWLAQNGMAELRLSEAQWRALTLATGVAGDLTLNAAAALAGADNRLPMLQLVPILPFDWHIEQRRAASLWLKHVVERSGWPSECIYIPAAPLADASQATSSAVFRRLAQDALEKTTPLVALVIACASHIGQETVDRWSASGKLFTAARPQGSIPGEGAAGLLLTDAQQARSIGHREVVMLEPMQEARHAVSVDEVKRTDPGVLEELTRRVVQGRHADFMGVAMIVADTGHRSSRMLELMGYASVTMPQLDDSGDIVCLGVACGSCDAVPFITALALARHYALERFGSILCVSNEDARLRHAALVQPDAPASA